jgi:hypothetical protein
MLKLFVEAYFSVSYFNFLLYTYFWKAHLLCPHLFEYHFLCISGKLSEIKIFFSGSLGLCLFMETIITLIYAVYICVQSRNFVYIYDIINKVTTHLTSDYFPRCFSILTGTISLCVCLCVHACVITQMCLSIYPPFFSQISCYRKKWQRQNVFFLERELHES